MGRKTQMNSLTTPELLAKVNPENKELLQEFLDYLRSMQRSEGTISGYEHDINIAFVWALQYNNNLPFIEWKKRHIVKYQNWLLNENKNSPARIRRLKAALSSMGNYIEAILDEDYPNYRNIINKIESPVNNPVREKTVLTEDDVDKILSTLVERKKYKQACFFALAVFGGRRKAELCRFRMDDFTQDRLVCDGALYKSKPLKTKGRGGGKMLECYTLAKRFQPYLDMWVAERKEKNIESEWLFPQKDDPSQHMGITTANSYAKTFSRIAGKEVYMHSLRHRLCSYLSESGLPDSVIQQFFGWSSCDLVKVYDDSSKDDKFAKYFRGGEITVANQKNLSEL